MAKLLKTDILVVGGGAAGLSAVVHAQGVTRKILLVCKGRTFHCGSTFRNRNGYWGVTFAENEKEKESLLGRINRISCGTNIPELSSQLVEESPLAVEMLRKWGVEFRKEPDGSALTRVSPCFCRQKLAVLVQSCEQVAGVARKMLQPKSVAVLEQCRVTKLLMENGQCCGCLAIGQGGIHYEIHAGAVIITTGGQAGCFQPNLVEPGLTGDGYSLLTDVGIKLKNMEFLQRVWENSLETGPRFSTRYFAREDFRCCTADGVEIELPSAESALMRQRITHVPISNLQPDRVIDQLMLAQCGDPWALRPIHVFLKNSKKEMFSLLPHVQAGNGGVEIGCNGETVIPGLYAAGEVTTGMHGGDRVGGMMITSALVFGRRAGLAAARYVAG